MIVYIYIVYMMIIYDISEIIESSSGNFPRQNSTIPPSPAGPSTDKKRPGWQVGHDLPDLRQKS